MSLSFFLATVTKSCNRAWSEQLFMIALISEAVARSTRSDTSSTRSQDFRQHNSAWLDLQRASWLPVAEVLHSAGNSRPQLVDHRRGSLRYSRRFRGEASSLAAGGAVVAYTPHFNQQRRECLVEITNNRSDAGSAYDQIFNPKDGTFVASRTRPASVRSASDGVDEVIVMGASVAVQQKSAAQAWFRDLMTK